MVRRWDMLIYGLFGSANQYPGSRLQLRCGILSFRAKAWLKKGTLKRTFVCVRGGGKGWFFKHWIRLVIYTCLQLMRSPCWPSANPPHLIHSFVQNSNNVVSGKSVCMQHYRSLCLICAAPSVLIGFFTLTGRWFTWSLQTKVTHSHSSTEKTTTFICIGNKVITAYEKSASTHYTN